MALQRALGLGTARNQSHAAEGLFQSLAGPKLLGCVEYGLDADPGVEDGDRELALRSLFDELPHQPFGPVRFREDEGTGNHLRPASRKHGGEFALSPGLKQSDRNAFERLRVGHWQVLSFQSSVVSKNPPQDWFD